MENPSVRNYLDVRAQGPASIKLSSEVIQEMEKLDAAVVVPSFVQDQLLGFVVLGDKKSKRLYTESDLDTLATLANQAALAIENCIFIANFEHQWYRRGESVPIWAVGRC